ncbi:hypothetical protein K3495_g16935, partial [Podosphaera aphanis]
MSYSGEGSTQTGQPNINSILIEIMESNRTMRKMMEDMQTRESENRMELDRLRREMGQLPGVVQGPNQENQLPTLQNFNPSKAGKPIPAHPQSFNTSPTTKVKPLKWPEPYDHKDQTQWAATHSLLQYIYNRDVVERGLLSPADFFTSLYSQAVTGNAKVMVSGQFQDRMTGGQIDDALGFLQVMDDTFRDRNAEQVAASLFYACRQFKD